MDESSNLSGSTTETPVFTGVLVKSAPIKIRSAPKRKFGVHTIYEIKFEVEEPNLNQAEMVHQVNCITCNYDVTKRWYVEYYITCKETNKRIRKRDYGFVNKEKDPDKRLNLLQSLQTQVINNLEFQSTKQDNFVYDEKSSITYFLNQYLIEKRKVCEEETIRTYVRILKSFHKFLIRMKLTASPPHIVTKKILLDYRSDICDKVANRTANNYMDEIKSFFNYLIKEHENVLFKNPCDSITKLVSRTESHIAYSKTEAEAISIYLKENDPQLLLYCRFIAYGFLRCKETRRLRVGDLDFDKRTITLSAKNAKTGKRIVKPMLHVFHDYLLDLNLHKYQKDHYVFTTSDFPGEKMTYEKYFQLKFQNVKKLFGLTEKHTIYSFRHTFVCELLASGASWHEIMKYTGHTTMASFEKYARSILNAPAIDLSANIKIKF